MPFLNLASRAAPNANTPYDLQLAEIKRQQLLAEALQQGVNEPIPINEYKGTQAPIPWTAILGKALGGLNAGASEQAAQQQLRDLGEQGSKKAALMAELLTKGRKGMPTPEMTVDGTLPQLPGGPAPTPGPQATIPATDGYTKLSPEEQMAVILGSGGSPQEQAITQMMGPQILDEQNYARRRADQIKDKTRHYLSPAELKARGYRDGAVVSVDPFGNPETEQAAPELSKQDRIDIAAASRQPSEGSWGQPVVEIGPDGKPIQVRYNNKGGRMVVQGAVPKDASRMLGPNALKSIETVSGKLEALGRLRSTYKPEYSGNISGDFGNWAARNNPFSGPSPKTDWWQGYNEYVAKVRNELFGASLTPGESEEFNKFIITPRMAPDIAQSNLQRQYQITARAAQRTANPYVKQGYNQEAVEAAMGGMTMDDLNKIDTRVARGETTTQNQGPSQEDQEALAWLKAHPNDPRAEAVRKKLGVK